MCSQRLKWLQNPQTSSRWHCPAEGAAAALPWTLIAQLVTRPPSLRSRNSDWSDMHSRTKTHHFTTGHTMTHPASSKGVGGLYLGSHSGPSACWAKAPATSQSPLLKYELFRVWDTLASKSKHVVLVQWELIFYNLRRKYISLIHIE